MLALAFMLVALILFVIAALGVEAGRYNLIAIGLAFMAASFLVGLTHP
jgi:hypothetical protein